MIHRSGPRLLIAGALIGGAIGAGTAAVVDDKQVDLGKPIWKN